MSFGVGLLTGLTSIGGAVLLTPLLVVFGVRPLIAVGTDLTCSTIMKAAGAWVHWRNSTVDFRAVAELACGSFPFGLIGAWVVTHLPRGGEFDTYVRQAIGLALGLAALVFLLRTVRGSYLWISVPIRRHMRWLTVAWGAVAGLAVGMTSIGGGSLIAPLLMLRYPFSPERAVGTDLCHAAMLALVTGLVHTHFGTVDWKLAGPVLAGSLPGAFAGSYLAPRIPSRALRLSMGMCLLGTAVALF